MYDVFSEESSLRPKPRNLNLPKCSTEYPTEYSANCPLSVSCMGIIFWFAEYLGFSTILGFLVFGHSLSENVSESSIYFVYEECISLVTERGGRG